MTVSEPPDASAGAKPRPRRRVRRWILPAVVVAAALVLVRSTGWFAAFGGTPHGERLAAMKRSPHFRDGVFENPVPTDLGARGSFWGTLRRYLTGNEQRVPATPIPTEELGAARFESPPPPGLRLTWLGHSTVLIEIDGHRLLTDPVWARRCSPSDIIGPQRFHPPPLPIDHVPRLDAIVVSHDHYDHLDQPTVTSLAATGVPFYAPLGVGAHLEKWGIDAKQIHELDWWERARIGARELTLVATPARHFSGRGVLDQNVTAWASWVIWGPSHRVFFSGDTGWFPGFEEIGADLGPFDATLLEIGAYDESWRDVHLGPAGALRAHRALRGRLLVPIHWGTFNVALHAWHQPAERLFTGAKASGAAIAVPRPGETIDVERPAPAEPWWR